MRYIVIALLLSSCATSRDLDQLRLDLTAHKLHLEETRYHLQIESCRSSTLICGLATQNESACMKSFAVCITKALESFREKYGKDPSSLIDEPKRAR